VVVGSALAEPPADAVADGAGLAVPVGAGEDDGVALFVVVGATGAWCAGERERLGAAFADVEPDSAPTCPG
jgi:hypothetical protein